MRQCVGPDCKIMVDANQKWGVAQAIDWMKQLSEFKLMWIEEPTCPDDIFGHLEISKALKPYGKYSFFLICLDSTENVEC